MKAEHLNSWPTLDHPLDVLAVGAGPFNLSLAALASRLPDVRLVALDRNDAFSWHSGVMFEDAKLQLSFLADLVTLVEPTHPLSFLAYLGHQKRLYPFFIRERFHPTRREYEHYLQWVVTQLPSVKFGYRVDLVEWSAQKQCFVVSVTNGTSQHVVPARNIAVGIGTEGGLPPCLSGLISHVVHSSAYLMKQKEIKQARRVTVVGSGQSGGEVMLDLLRHNAHNGQILSWLTRTRTFAPLDYTKLVLEMTTPDYVRYFHALPESKRDHLVAAQWQHYKGLSSETIDDLHDALYTRRITGAPPVELRYGISVQGAVAVDEGIRLRCHHADTGTTFEHETDIVIAATGYKERKPSFLEPLLPLLERDAAGRFRVGLDYSLSTTTPIPGRIFVANAETHTHGVATPDLGTCAFRSATILNTVTNRRSFPLPEQTAFTAFDPPAATTMGGSASK
jgi:lysine N6-hydroxylase